MSRLREREENNKNNVLEFKVFSKFSFETVGTLTKNIRLNARKGCTDEGHASYFGGKGLTTQHAVSFM